MRKLLTVSLACLTLSACSTATHQEVTSFYDYQLFTPDAQAVSLSRFGKDIQNADIILVGEWHTHSGVHRFQTDLVKALISQGHDVAVSMEQFSRQPKYYQSVPSG